jgi:hypothetical protein
LFIADGNNNKIRVVNAATGIISTYAGTGLVGFSGDGGQATNARLNAPTWIAIDPADNVYFTDAGNNRIRKINHSTGEIWYL